jgi:hypothetical protein
MDPNGARVVDRAHLLNLRAHLLNLNDQPAKPERPAGTNTVNPNNQHGRSKLPQTRQCLWPQHRQRTHGTNAPLTLALTREPAPDG